MVTYLEYEATVPDNVGQPVAEIPLDFSDFSSLIIYHHGGNTYVVPTIYYDGPPNCSPWLLEGTVDPQEVVAAFRAEQEESGYANMRSGE